LSEATVIKKIPLKGFTLEELNDLMVSRGEPKFRGEQIFDWMYNHLITDFDQMQNIPKLLRSAIKAECELLTLNYVDSVMSPQSHTKKFIFATKDGNQIESVIIPDPKRTTLCISTQVGCPLDCKFCATGLMGYKKNLTPGEIFDQYLFAARDWGMKSITNIVYMGMGEPLLNFDNTVKSLQIYAEEKFTGLSLRKITVSTAGIAPKIKELAQTGLRVNLALSLHSCFEEIRSIIMPINKKYSLAENIDAVKYYSKATNTKITFEYVMLKGLNDRDEDIKALAKLCNEIPSKVNLIPFNSLKHMDPDGISAELESSTSNRIKEFAEKLMERNVTVTVRYTQGDDIAAACGQLANKILQ
jgi:23S rRNA (adenine2503-C2)-methyltransferase